MLAQERRADKGEGIGWDLLLIAIIAWRNWLPSCPWKVLSFTSVHPPTPTHPLLLFCDHRSSGLQGIGSQHCQTRAVSPSPSDTERPFGYGFDMIKHSPFLKVLLAVCFPHDLSFPPVTSGHLTQV